MARLADGAVAHQFDHLGGLRVRPIHEGLHEEAFVDSRGFHHRHHFGVVHAQRLFAQYGFAGLQRFNGPFGVLRVGRGDVDRVHLGIGEERVVTGVRADAVLIGEGSGRCFGAAADGCQLRGFGARHRRRQLVRDLSGCEDSPTRGHQ